MDPNANQPEVNGQVPGGQPQQPAAPQGDWPPPKPPVPDWQQGLGGPAAQPGQSVAPQMPQPQMPQAQAPQMPGAPGVVAGMPPAGPTMDGQMPAAMPGMGAPQNGQVMGMASPAKKMPFGLLMIIAAVVLVALAVASYFLFFAHKKPTTANNAAQTSANNAAKNAIDMSTLTNASFVAPGDLSAFEKNTSTNAAYSSYLTKGSTSTNACGLEFGNFTAEQLPGTDLNSIVAPQIESLKKAGATVDGPTASNALILKDSGTGKTTYSMPTISYKFSEGTKHASENYSLVILKNGSRAVVSRQCANANGAINQNTFNTVENTAKQVTVTKL